MKKQMTHYEEEVRVVNNGPYMPQAGYYGFRSQNFTINDDEDDDEEEEEFPTAGWGLGVTAGLGFGNFLSNSRSNPYIKQPQTQPSVPSFGRGSFSSGRGFPRGPGKPLPDQQDMFRQVRQEMRRKQKYEIDTNDFQAVMKNLNHGSEEKKEEDINKEAVNEDTQEEVKESQSSELKHSIFLN